MILSEQKPFEEILAFLGKDKSVFIIGCNGCAYSSGSGGPSQVADMKKKLEEAGKKVTGTKSAAFLCEKALVKTELRGKVNEVAVADSVLVLTCGVGIQAVAASINKVCHPGCNTINRGGSRGEWEGRERCFECGQCLLDFTGGICPLTACTKSLISGACGGANKGKCEVSQDRPCGWEQIYDRLKSRGLLDKLQAVINPLDHKKIMVNPKMMSLPLFGVENSRPASPKPAAPNAEVKTK
ncbi:MAG TPA: methylenetetrahydrofolate reductase C-terminal domain-containing protein [Dehalococcoidales bacterium]|nr:methylenetetrahydrofolate reductase C-terminal domain-containing protein [Dehalococcoidales bacterium]